MPAKRFRMPPAGFTLFCSAVMAGTLALAYWQHSRAQQKDAMQRLAAERMSAEPVALAEIEAAGPDAMLWRRAAAVGTFEASGGFLVDNRLHERRPGFHVVTPLERDGGWLLVNRGWVPAASPRVPAAVPEPAAGRVTVSGILAPDSGDAFELGDDLGEGGVWQNLKVDRWSGDTGREALPLVLLADSAPEGLVPVSTAPDFRADRSRGYRLQWLGLAAVAAAGWVAVGFRSGSA